MEEVRAAIARASQGAVAALPQHCVAGGYAQATKPSQLEVSKSSQLEATFADVAKRFKEHALADGQNKLPWYTLLTFVKELRDAAKQNERTQAVRMLEDLSDKVPEMKQIVNSAISGKVELPPDYLPKRFEVLGPLIPCELEMAFHEAATKNIDPKYHAGCSNSRQGYVIEWAWKIRTAAEQMDRLEATCLLEHLSKDAAEMKEIVDGVLSGKVMLGSSSQVPYVFWGPLVPCKLQVHFEEVCRKMHEPKFLIGCSNTRQPMVLEWVRDLRKTARTMNIFETKCLLEHLSRQDVSPPPQAREVVSGVLTGTVQMGSSDPAGTVQVELGPLVQSELAKVFNRVASKKKEPSFVFECSNSQQPRVAEWVKELRGVIQKMDVSEAKQELQELLENSPDMKVVVDGVLSGSVAMGSSSLGFYDLGGPL
eukprot:TRINITY_DN61931_c0_g1_i1.p1 TRINITY_DN61931_c0_g1~~TRINITY_DN61931_c0_g1_i1.p1  ORF type:complete len:456 (+),score=87.21 TRINITY_DN61931_c0_g1_i1:99-1370(+)